MGTGSMAYVCFSSCHEGECERNNLSLQPTAHFGAFVFGSDIDGRQMKGKRTFFVQSQSKNLSSILTEKSPGVIRAATQYGVESRIIDLATFDITQNPWRCGQLFDAIVTDPPCKVSVSPSAMTKFDPDGVRAGAKRLGRKKSLP